MKKTIITSLLLSYSVTFFASQPDQSHDHAVTLINPVSHQDALIALHNKNDGLRKRIKELSKIYEARKTEKLLIVEVQAAEERNNALDRTPCQQCWHECAPLVYGVGLTAAIVMLTHDSHFSPQIKKMQ